MATLDELLTPLKVEDVVADALAVLEANGSPVTAWGPTDEPRATIEWESRILVDVSERIVAIGELATLSKATGDALTLHASEWFDEDRRPAVQNQGTVTLTDSSGSIRNFVAGSLIFTSSVNPDLVWTNRDAIAVPANGALVVTIIAASPGSAWNVAGQTLYLGTPQPALALAAANGTGWITQTGADLELDESMRARCLAKWATVVSTGPRDAYVKWALDASAEINRAQVIEDATAVPPVPAVRVVIASPAGPPSLAALLAVETYVDERRPIGILVGIDSAGAYAVEVRGTAKVSAAFASLAPARIDAALRGYLETLPIGSPVYVSQVVELILAIDGVVDLTLTDGIGAPLAVGAIFGGIIPAADSVATLTNLLVVQAV